MPNIVGRTFAAWRVLRLVDATGKRATAICDCGAVREVTIEALITGASCGCGCLLTPRPPRLKRPPAARLTFVREVNDG